MGLSGSGLQPQYAFGTVQGGLLGFDAGKQAGINAEAVVELAFGPPYHLPTAYLAPSRPPFVRLLQSLETDRERHRENAAKMTA